MRRVAVIMVGLLVLVLVVVGSPSLASGAADGGLYAFGYNAYGQLGSATNNGTNTANPTPTRVVLPGVSGAVTQLAAGADHSLALTSSGQLYAFGANYYGQLGSATNSATFNASPTPTPVVLPLAAGPVTQIAAGADHSLAVTSAGELYAFGNNSYGQLGSATNSGMNKANPNPTPVGLSPGAGRVTQIAAGGDHSLALTASGELYAFGDNSYGQLGSATNNGTNNANPTPTPVALPPGAGPVTQIAAGYGYSLAVTASGQLYAFGRNYYGQLGSATNNGTNNANPTPTPVGLPPEAGPVTQIAAGSDHSLALTASGELYAFGDNYYGELGSATNSGTNNANPTPRPVELPVGAGRVTQITAGQNDSMAVTSSGQLYAFGRNDYGQLGSATNTGTQTANPTPLRVVLPAGLTAVTLARGEDAFHTLVVLSRAPATTPPTSPGTTPPTPPGTTNSPGATPPTSPILSGFVASPTTLSLAGRLVNGRCVKPTRKNRHHKQCTWPTPLKLSYKLTTAATVSFTLAIQRPGRKAKGGCRAPSKQNNKHARCTRLIGVPGSISQPSIAGANTFTFRGRIGGTTLAPGSYVLTATPTANGRPGKPQSVTIKLVK